MQLRVEGLVVLELAEGRPHARRGNCVGLTEAALGDELLGLTGVRLVLQAVLSPSDDAVEDHSLLRVSSSRPQAGLRCEFVVLPHSIFEPVQLTLTASGSEVVTVHVEHDVALCVVEHARRGDTLSESKLGNEGTGILLLPAVGCCPSAVHVPEQLRT